MKILKITQQEEEWQKEEKKKIFYNQFIGKSFENNKPLSFNKGKLIVNYTNIEIPTNSIIIVNNVTPFDDNIDVASIVVNKQHFDIYLNNLQKLISNKILTPIL